ncbi:class I SAM-dependent methyltransferase [Halobacteriales archaeon QH_8_67_27]|nr:MAG: class I SAM-dependent methyltransferase [Halobacteriales archaeon QH_8_67_27]
MHGGRKEVAELVEQFLTAVDGEFEDALARPPRALDVGCGPGWESASLAEAGFDAVSFDLTRSFLEEARERVPDASVVRGDMRALPLADGSFDGLWACASLLHIPESEVKPTLADFERVLVDGGVVLVSMKRAGGDDGTTEESPYDSDERHFERYEPETLTRLFTEAGFTVRDRAADENWVAVCAVA